MSRFVRVVFILHGVITLAAAVVLAVAPAAIPATVGIDISPDDVLLPFLLAGAELGVAVVSLGAARLTDRRALRLIAAAFAALHLATGVLESVYAGLVGGGAVLVANVVVRAVVGAFFLVTAIRLR